MYGNDAGIRNNRSGQRLLALTTESCDPVAWQIHKEGLAFLAGDYDPSVLREIAAAIAAKVEDPQHSEVTFAAKVPGNEAPARTIRHPQAVIPEIRRLVSAPIRQAVKAYYGSDFRVVEVGAWRTYHIDNPMIDAYSNFWHFDRLNTAHLRLFVYFTDGISRDSGAFRIRPPRIIDDMTDGSAWAELPAVAEDFSYSSDANFEWLGDDAIRQLLARVDAG